MIVRIHRNKLIMSCKHTHTRIETQKAALAGAHEYHMLVKQLLTVLYDIARHINAAMTRSPIHATGMQTAQHSQALLEA